MKRTQLHCLCMILLHLLHTAGSERFEVLGPTDLIVTVAGDDIILPCYLKPNISAEDMTVDWLNLDFLDRRVYRYQNHRVIRDDQIPSYRGRTSLFEKELWRGNTSLKLTRVQGTDEGRYKCFIKAKSWYDDFTIQVLVKAVGSKPVVSIEGHREGGLGLLCKSEGWHPEPELVWLDSKGVHLSAGPPETHRDLEGFYTVKLHVIVQETDTNRFTCRVQQSRINEKMETEVHLPSELFDTTPWRKTSIVSCCLGAITVIGLSLAIYCICNKKDDLTKEKGYLTGKLDEIRTERDHLTEQRDYLKKEREDLWAQNNDLCAKNNEIMKDKDDLTGKLDEIRTERLNLWAQNNEIREERTNLSALNNHLTEQRDDLKKERDDLKKEKAMAEKDLTSQLDQLKEDMNEIRKDKDFLKVETVRLREEKAMVEKDLTSQLDDLRKEKDKLGEQNNYLTEKLVDVTRDPDTASPWKGET